MYPFAMKEGMFRSEHSLFFMWLVEVDFIVVPYSMIVARISHSVDVGGREQKKDVEHRKVCRLEEEEIRLMEAK